MDNIYYTACDAIIFYQDILCVVLQSSCFTIILIYSISQRSFTIEKGWNSRSDACLDVAHLPRR